MLEQRLFLLANKDLVGKRWMDLERMATTGNVETKIIRQVKTANQQRFWTRQGLQTIFLAFLEANKNSIVTLPLMSFVNCYFDFDDDIYRKSYGCPPKGAGRQSLSKQK